jgi:two-component system response regulator (stage 0 sporulation protein A)
MNIDQKVNAIMRYIVAETREEKNLAISEIKKIMERPAEMEKSTNIEEAIDSILTEIGMPCHFMGYNYVVYAIKIAIENPDILNNITSVLYPTIANKYETTASRVERGIRHAIEHTWDRADLDVTEKYFGNTISIKRGKPTNSEFIARMANIVKRRIANG